MSHNSPNEVVLHAEDERFLRILAKRAVNGSARLSYFERQTAYSLNLHKAISEDGHIDLNVAANLMHQSKGTRRSPNVLAAERHSDEGWAPRSGVSNKVQKSQADLTKEACNCARHCQKNGQDVQGRTNCPRCHGAGYSAYARQQADKAVGISQNHARDLVDQSLQGE